MMDDPRLRVPLLLVTALALHLAVLSELRVAGVAPELMLLLAVAGGIVDGPVRGSILGFTSGMALDVFLSTPMGLSALVFSLVGYAVGLVSRGLMTPSWYLPVLTASIGSAAGVLLYALAGAMLGEPMVTRRLTTIAAVVAVGNAVLAPLALRLVAWALATDSHARSRALQR